MRKLMMACMFGLLPVMGVATAGSAAAAAPGNMTVLDRLATTSSIVDEVRYRRGYRCYRVCTRRNYRGRCVRSAQRCYRPVRRYHRW
ncbi:MAG: hypothetical protein J0I57_01405 [Hyphomicrobium sp.]|uniref:hypothetical protein n=1 Tax=Hyphomicrobium sp. CS1BSMeth3 TaxID=1892844 RepID=UPI00086960FD|nr:hypothetical protein [Hyphomicrobium sp. CS1BSMeth3]MBN9259746.1 hypothetical protein [Hyphomicrobium sp.]ODT30695.1 MAG: hypothetical protein ABS54_01815 [Hyphomicrobium sp. SCN 65-11]OJU28742.1 MAG: hypothetical protein BGN89_01685 [Alphaproteobacteria bacterium 64-6]MBN9264126.1 hypothetical protein [Hyphomicrobium sp.]MBN9276278.1 hypothetical protein [Hyphomicrobium sp.]